MDTLNPIYKQFHDMVLLLTSPEIDGETCIFENSGTIHVVTQTGPLVKIETFPSTIKGLIIREYQSSQMIGDIRFSLN